MKGIILAGGTGSRLYPITLASSKQLLPVYDKPMIYYPLSVLMLAKIKEVLIIIDEKNSKNFYNLLGDGSHLGLKIQYAYQSKPRGIADAFLIAEKFINQDKVCLILGDNIFYGQGLVNSLEVAKKKNGATIFCYPIENPSNFGIMEFDKNLKAKKIIEKPKKTKSNYAVTGLYFYDKYVVKYAKSIKPSKRGELEITDINKIYLAKKKLNVEILGRGFAWLDTGNYDSLLAASQFVQTIEKRQGYKIACIEEISYKNLWINKGMLNSLIKKLKEGDYKKYLKKIITKSK